MKNSLVLVIGLTPTCTELARHLVLSGTNVWLQLTEQQEQATITDEDIQSDFLFSQADIGSQRCQVVKSKLSEMNPFCEIETVE